MLRRRIQRRSPRADDRLPGSLHPVLRRVYLNRGIGEPSGADLSLARLLPFHALKGIDQAVELLCEALRHQWHVCVIGDYDADGATSTALVVSLLRQFGLAQVSYLVPDRFRYGYGLTPEIVALARLRKPDLLITVDNGIASVEGVAGGGGVGGGVGAAGCRRHRQPQPAGLRFPEQGAGRGRRGLLPVVGAAGAAACTRGG
jgi:single-stranded-DNA-specific exonuclease